MSRMSPALLVKQLTALLALAAVFVIASLVAEHYRSVLIGFVGTNGVFGMSAYIFLTALFVIFVIPLDIALLIPLGTIIWGPLLTALMSITGWTLGAALAFGIARRFGAPLVGRLIGFSRVRTIENRIPKKNLFLMVIFLRMLVSVDILSYALGLFSTMSWGSYIIATTIGVAPFGFYFAYTGTLPIVYRFVAIALAFFLATFAIVRYGIEREP
ncbi:MAG TPA: VTT domain-containing protein [Candidatus Paceibacterota bacterium]|nr:VTT domain-containing protein [Candidatus Paceibacterota bacterium]